MRELVVDTETTGLNYKNGDRIIEVACVELINHVATGNKLQFYCSTNKAIDKEAEKIHGLSNNFLNNFPPISEKIQIFLNFIKNDTLIIHNADFDLGFINNELKLLNFQPLKNKYIDTVSLARKKLNSRSVNLDFLCRHFSIDLSLRRLHGALLDCQLLSEVYLELLGGRQICLELSKKNPNKEMISKKNKTTEIKKTHQIQISTEEIKQHKKLINTLKNPLWDKINY